MKVLHILGTNRYSGAENIAITIIKYLNDKFESAYCSLDGTIRGVCEKNKIKFLPINSTNNKEIKKVIEDWKPDIIHAHDFNISVKVALLGVRIPIISHIHHNPPWISSINLRTLAYLATSYKFRTILVVSNSVLDQFKFNKYILEKTYVIGNPIEIKKILNSVEKNNPFMYDIAYLGRLVDVKDPIRFINIISELSQKFKGISAIMIGTGNLEDECKMLISKLGLENNIKLVGFQVNPYKYIAQSKLLLVTSKWEGFGLAAIESLALGVPVVATNTGGLKSIVDNSCGILFDNDEMAINEISKILLDEKHRLNKSKGANKKAKQFDNIEEYMNLLSDIYYKTCKR